ncbi:MAG TPA: serine hydrolase domain-containing protein [Candidatus Limnocylindrales bacterium]|nr:serine hydrolase domain-containing protein [Candidatus Limnocylindrales bacterium]
MSRMVALALLALSLSGCAAASSGPSASAATASPAGAKSPEPMPTPSPTASAAIAEPSLPACTGPESVGCVARAVKEAGDRGEFAGAVLIARQGEPIWQGSFGETAESIPITVETPMGIASAGKMFTGVAVAQLLQDGKLPLDDTVGMHVRDLPERVGQATIKQLLTHTSGLASEHWSVGRAIEPGTFRYSNTGFVLLAMVVESVTGQAFEDYVGQAIFAPAGMDDTTFPADENPGLPRGAGGQRSTTSDMLRFANELLGHTFLDEVMTNEATSIQVTTDFGGYGYGFGIFTGLEDEVPSIGHIGAAPSVVAAVEMSPTLDHTVIVLCDRGFDSIKPALTDFQKAIGMGYWRG